MDDIQYQDPSMDNLLSPSQPLQINFQVGSQTCISKFISLAYNPWAQCVLTQGISIPHPETQTVDWVMLVTPGFCQATSRCTVDLHTEEKPQLMIDEKLQLTPFPQYKVAPQSPHIETFAWKWNWYLGFIINMLALVNECCGVNH